MYKFKNYLLLFLLFFCSLASAADVEALKDLTKRLIPTHTQNFIFTMTPASADETVTLYSKNGKIYISGNTLSSMSYGLNYYLNRFGKTSVSWSNMKPILPQKLIMIPKKIVLNSKVENRFMYNYCTFSYTMAFWDWKRWEQELDWMALHGVNKSLALVGQEAVWQKTLSKFGYSDQEIKKFICGPAFTAWWLMGNLEGWGGPVSQSWIDNQADLQQKIVNRMRELGITPIMQGFFSMVPNSLKEKFPEAHVYETGKWLSFKRPAMLLPDSKLFFDIAKTYYQEQAKLYGKTDYFLGDPFHEGSVPAGVNVKDAATGIYKAMSDFQPNAVWVLQAWQDNPRPILLEGIPKGKALVIDLMAEARPQYGGDKESIWYRKDGFNGHNFIYSILPNFGGRTGMAAKLDRTVAGMELIKKSPFVNEWKGIGASPEGTEQDPVYYDLLFDLNWQLNDFSLDQWMKNYTTTRYGKFNQQVYEAWQVLRNTVYNSQYGKLKDPPFESILTTRPAWGKTMTSGFGYDEMDYDPARLTAALKILINNAKYFPKNKNYTYDLVNITRQVLDNYGHVLYKKIEKEHKNNEKAAFAKDSKEFKALILDVDELLGTKQEFLLGTWLAHAKTAAPDSNDNALNEWNARTLITTWTYEVQAANDYAYREYSGLIKDFYYKRWEMFFSSIDKKWDEFPKPLEFLEMEKAWCKEKKIYPTVAKADPVVVVNKLLKKYSGKL